MGRKRFYNTAAERLLAWRRRNGMPIRIHHTSAERMQRMRKKAQSLLKVYHRSQSTEWETPHAFFETLHAEFHFTCDVCAQPANAKCPHFFTPADDGLAQVWTGSCWMNPPYGRTISLWVKKAYESSLQGALVVCLVPVRTDTKWWQAYASKGEIRFLARRLTFVGAQHPAPFPNAVVIFRPTSEDTL